MSVSADVVVEIDHFNRAQVLSTTPGARGWTVKDTSPAGTPTYLCITEDGGAMALTLSNTNEAQIVTMFLNDVLVYDLRQIQRVWWICRVSGIDAQTNVAWGLASAQNDTLDNVTINAWFRIKGPTNVSNVIIETDDDVSDVNDRATGATLGATYKKFELDFGKGLSDIRFSIDGQPVGAQTFSLAGAAAGQNVQPFVQLQKASGTGVPAITIAQFGVQYAYSYGT